MAIVQNLTLPETQSESLEMARIQLQMKQLEQEKELKQLEFEIKERRSSRTKSQRKGGHCCRES